MRSREEEEGPVRLYRPQDYPFPPARGREGLSLCSDGTFKYLTPGRNDKPAGATGHWHGDPLRSHPDRRRYRRHDDPVAHH